MNHLPSVGSSSKCWRRRSADVGGLNLAVGNNGHGQGWAGGTGELETEYAELLGDMYTQTLHAVNEHGSDFVPTDLPPSTRSRLIRSLERWHFEPHKLPDEEVLSCTLILFEGLYRIEGMEEAIGVPFKQISPFVHHLRQIYRLENSYHNFEHALDVLQATHSYLRAARMVPPLSILHEPARKWKSDRAFDSGALITSLGLQDLFVLYIAAIGHDVGHPGFTNLFMKNAETPLSVVYDGRSALEQMHYQLLLRVMRCHGLGGLLDDTRQGLHVRKLLWETVLATDMSVHDRFMKDLQETINGRIGPVCLRQVITCQAIMKCADISNPSRPYPVSQYWASALIEEWSSQALFEKFLHLPTTVQSSDSPLNEAKSQVFFSTNYAKPLLDLVIQAIPEMKPFADQCTSNLRRWTKRVKHLESTKHKEDISPATSTPRHPDEFMTAFPLTLPPAHRIAHPEPTLIWPTTTSRSSESSSTSTSSDSNLCSPAGSVSSFAFSPVSDSFHSCRSHLSSGARPSSSSGSSSSSSGGLHVHSPLVPDVHAAIRAAGKLGIRKQKSMNRNSWSPSAFSMTTTTTMPGGAGIGIGGQQTTTTKSAVAFLVSTNGAILDGQKPKGVPETIVVNPIKLEKSKLARVG